MITAPNGGIINHRTNINPIKSNANIRVATPNNAAPGVTIICENRVDITK